MLPALGAAVAVLALAVAAPDAPGATLYVAPGGSDSGPGTLARPWRTLQRAAGAAGPGTVVAVRAGTYAGFRLTRSGAAGAPIVFRPYGDGAVVVDGRSRSASTIEIDGARWVELRGLVVQRSGGQYNAGVMIDGGAADVRVVGATLRANRSYGVRIYASQRVAIDGNRITGNDSGVRLDHVTGPVTVTRNTIGDNDGMVVNTPCSANCHDDSGAAGIVLYKTTGAVRVSGNAIHGHGARSSDYGWDGSGLEIFGASNVQISGNRIWNNVNVLETGTNGGMACARNRFTNNRARGAAAGGGYLANGLILRCAQDMRVEANTFSDLDLWTYDVNLGSGFSGGVAGLAIVGNTAEQFGHKVYNLAAGGVTVDRNRDTVHGGAAYATVRGETVTTLERMRALGYQQNGSLSRR
jgi:hypothetical protein